MAFNLVFLRAHNVLTQQKEANPTAPLPTMILGQSINY